MPPSRSFLLIVCAAFMLAGCGREPSPQESAQRFFNLLAEGKTGEAYSSGSFAFQAEQNERVFEQTAKEQGFIGAKSVELQPISSELKEAKFTAKVTTADGEARTYIGTFQKDGKAWKVYSIKAPRGGNTHDTEAVFSQVGKGAAFSDAVSQPKPDEKATQRLIQRTMQMFNEAVHRGSFDEFYKNVSVSWQTQLTEKQLQRAFQPFIDQKVDVTGALALTPELDGAPQITTEGLYFVNGHYPSNPYQVEFALKFIYELPEWKLFGIDVNLRKAQEK